MPRPFKKIAAAPSEEGTLELHQRGPGDFLLLVDGRVLMTTALRTSELFLAEAGCAVIRGTPNPQVLIGGLGLGLTLQAALRALPADARVIVSELNPAIVTWCQGPLAAANGGAAKDPRVTIQVEDVTREVARVAAVAGQDLYDAILWDLYVGPSRQGEDRHPLYGRMSLRRTFLALRPGGVFGVWCETPSSSFERRLEAVGFRVALERTRGKGLRHAVYLAHKPGSVARSATATSKRGASPPSA